MSRSYRAQQAGLTRAVNSGDPIRVLAEVKRTVAEWDEQGAWPDNWHRWNSAWHDALFKLTRVHDLRFYF